MTHAPDSKILNLVGTVHPEYSYKPRLSCDCFCVSKNNKKTYIQLAQVILAVMLDFTHCRNQNVFLRPMESWLSAHVLHKVKPMLSYLHCSCLFLYHAWLGHILILPCSYNHSSSKSKEDIVGVLIAAVIVLTTSLCTTIFTCRQKHHSLETLGSVWIPLCDSQHKWNPSEIIPCSTPCAVTVPFSYFFFLFGLFVHRVWFRVKASNTKG